MNGAEERARHPEGKAFRKFFERLLLCHTGSCWERDVLRDNKEVLWATWKAKAEADREPELCINCDGKGSVLGDWHMDPVERCPACKGKGTI